MTTEAALKAWETRRRNGWVHPNARDPVEETRRPSKKPKKLSKQAAALSERAKKAWATRRANEAAAKRKKRRG